MKIIHTGDLHLDSPFSGLDPVTSEKRRGALRAAFSSLVVLAKTENVQLFLICGDLFDDECITKDTINAVINEMASFKECTFVITPGNHDPYNQSSPYRLVKWPDNVFVFNTESLSFVEFEHLNTRIYGSAYFESTKTSFSDSVYKAKQDGKINILMHHGDIDFSRSVYCPLNVAALDGSGFDYAALGHIHKGTEVLSSGSTKYAYCGCIEGRDFGETGYKGAIIGDIEKGEVNLRHVRIGAKRYETVTIDVSGANAFSDVLTDVINVCTGFGGDTLLRVELTGITSEGFSADEELLRQAVPSVSYLEIKDKTQPLMNISRLKEDKTLAGEFYRKLEDKINRNDEQERRTAVLALKYGLRAIYAMEIKA